jgi:hypothetical protein
MMKLAFWSWIILVGEFFLMLHIFVLFTRLIFFFFLNFSSVLLEYKKLSQSANLSVINHSEKLNTLEHSSKRLTGSELAAENSNPEGLSGPSETAHCDVKREVSLILSLKKSDLKSFGG